ncbi:T9SS type A sorting domain-containing protein [uncultured Polaribacter sp.]|uniref:T9SS type A sorting domain-containing protein n=1 Tax=uncultured Polaribacter sp. TaxID=174711 RepID=UPI002628F9CA|nr:T9SS type A sorting domain-containing protein [uncultured Polaribacter sp.]
MKKFNLILLLIVTSFISYAQSVSVTESYITSSPIGTVENNGTSTAGFTLSESSGVLVPATAIANLPNMSINVNLQYVKLKDDDIANITGVLLNYFDVTYSSINNSLSFKQNTELPANFSGSVEFDIDVIQNSNQDQSLNGFNINIAAVDKNTNAIGSGSSFTYTDASIPDALESNNTEENNEEEEETDSSLSIDKVDNLLFQLSPNPTTGLVHIKLEDINDTKVELYNILGKKILTKKYFNVDKVSLNIDSLPAAIYLVKVTSNTGATNTVKILKK